jgi:branched-subunit amino acid aminotransferase/4-amino-4-deoxychorismate lyase
MIKALINNQWESIPKENLQLGTDTFSFSSGLYETFRTLDFKPVFLQPHLDRLFSSANRIGLNIQFTQSDILDMLSKVIHDFHDPNQRVRILAVPNKLIVYTSYLNLDPSIYNGVSVITIEASRAQPEIKTTDYHACLTAWKAAVNAGCFEAILMDGSGILYEGSRSNLFWVKDAKLFTRKEDVLPGTTRQIIINHSSVSIQYNTLNSMDLSNIDEVFLTNSGSGIIPVTSINDKNIGNGSVGIITRQLLSKYNEWMLKEIAR